MPIRVLLNSSSASGFRSDQAAEKLSFGKAKGQG
jgi:hypothetical protein